MAWHRSTWSSPRKVDTGLSFFRPFVLRRGDVPQRRVSPLRVVKDLDVFDDRGPRLGPGGEVRAVDQFRLRRGEQALHGGVAPAARPPAHAARDAVPPRKALV